DVRHAGACEPRHDGVLRALGDLLHGLEIALGGDRKAGLDDVDAHLVEEFGDFQLLLVGHGGAGRLFAVAPGGVEDDDAVLLGLRLSSHWNKILLVDCAAPALAGSVSISPLSAQAKCPAGPQGLISRRSPSIERVHARATGPAVSAARTNAR